MALKIFELITRLKGMIYRRFILSEKKVSKVPWYNNPEGIAVSKGR